MRLLHVEAMLDRDKGIQPAKHKAEVMKEHDDMTTRYAILSHRWGAEVNYEEMIGLMKMEEEEREDVKQRQGYQKIIEGCKQAMRDGYKWLWVDTCCIDKRSSAELSEAINSMFRWYENAQMCYAYLNDVGEPSFPAERDNRKFYKSNGWPEWFVRGWTLQELIAPKHVKFFNKDWEAIGNKQYLAPTLACITGIPSKVLVGGLAGQHLSVAQIMSWAANRRTTRVEDRAYSLMGLFGVNMPMLYGEGKKAFRRLQLEIIREFSDQSIFAWSPRRPRTGCVLAEDPSDFWDCGTVTKVKPDKFVNKLIWEYVEEGRSDSERLAALCDAVHSQQFHTFTVSNAGIQVFLPVILSRDSPSHFRAILACTRLEELVTIDLVSSGRSFARTSIDSLAPVTYPEFKTLHLIHYQDTNETRHESALDDKYTLLHGFTRRCTYPREFTGNTVTHSSLAEDLVVIIYANDDARSCFAVGFGHYLGQGWVHVVDGGHFPTREESWTVIGSRVYRRMWRARAEHAQHVVNHRNQCHDVYFIQHVHLPRSILAARVVWDIREAGDFKVMVDIAECPGCCGGPCTVTTAYLGTFSLCVCKADRFCYLKSDRDPLAVWGFMEMASCSYQLELDAQLIFADECFGQRIALGDYGDYSNGSLIRTGNIFEDMQATGIDLDDSYCSVVSHVSSPNYGREILQSTWSDSVVVNSKTSERHLVLHQPKAVSLPANEQISLLLKALSVCLAGKHLVTTVIQCSGFHKTGEDRQLSDSSDDSASDRSNHSTEGGLLTPLCIIARPHFWSMEPVCEQRKERFKSIRENFYALADMDQPTGTEQSHNFSNIQKKVIAMKFFSDLFGLEYLKKYIGDITFFTRSPLVIETSSVSDVPSVGPRAGWFITLCPPASEDGIQGGQKFIATESDPHPDVVRLLHNRWHTLCQIFRGPLWCTKERQEVEGEINSISQTLGAAILDYIVITGRNASLGQEWFKPAGQPKQLNTPSVVQDIKVLQVKLDATKDKVEQRALEEDLTGKILWFFLCGICVEVDKLLPKVWSCIGGENTLGCADVISKAVDCSTDSNDDQAHLRRIMLDAGVNTSKYQLWLDAQAAVQAKWSDTNRGTPAIDNQDMTLSTTPQTLLL